jgi:hypothetical protein
MYNIVIYKGAWGGYRIVVLQNGKEVYRKTIKGSDEFAYGVAIGLSAGYMNGDTAPKITKIDDKTAIYS